MDILHPTRILITSGAPQEPIDEVRYLGNRSSGKLGSHLGFVAACNGYEVTLLHGLQSVSPTSHPRLRAIPFSSTRDLAAKLREHWPSHEILIMAAAVADFTPRGGQQKGKKRRGEALTISFSPTEDLVASLAKSSRDDQKIIAFALEEADNLEESAKAKLKRKHVDAIVANPLETMDSSSIQASVLLKDGSTITPPENCSKEEFAVWLVNNLDVITRTTSDAP